MSISQASIDALFEGTTGGNSATSEATGAPAGTPKTSVPKPASAQPARAPDIQRILGLAVPVTVSLAERLMSIQSILEIRVGTIVEFDVPFDAELTLYAGNRSIAKGHAVKDGENFGLRITRIETVEERIEALGGHGSRA